MTYHLFISVRTKMISVVYRNPDDMIYEDILVKETSMGSRPGSLRRIQHNRLSNRSTRTRDTTLRSSNHSSTRRSKKSSASSSLARKQTCPVDEVRRVSLQRKDRRTGESIQRGPVDNMRYVSSEAMQPTAAFNSKKNNSSPTEVLSDMSASFMPASAIHGAAAVPASGSQYTSQTQHGSQSSRVQTLDRGNAGNSSQRSHRSRSSQRTRDSHRRRRGTSAPDSSTTDLAPERTSTPYSTPVTVRASQRRSQSLGRENTLATHTDSLQRSTGTSSNRSKTGRESRRRRRNRERAEERDRIRSNENLLAHSPQSSIRHDYDNPSYTNTENLSRWANKQPDEHVYASTSMNLGGQQSYPGTPKTFRSLHNYPSDASEQPPPYTALAASSVSNLSRLQNASSLSNLAKPVKPPVVPPYPSHQPQLPSTAHRADLPLPPYPAELPPYPPAEVTSVLNTSLPPPPPPSSSAPSTPTPYSRTSNEESRVLPIQVPRMSAPKQHWSKRRRSAGRSAQNFNSEIPQQILGRATSSDDSFRENSNPVPQNLHNNPYYYKQGGEVRRA